ncbi:MAG: hypothetical protein ACXWWQ_00515 [Candidatus Limnocylindria bacterium]
MRADRALSLLLPTLALVAEGAWLAVAYAAIETTVDNRVPLLGTFELAVAAGLAAVAVRRGWVRPDAEPGRFLAFLAVIGLAGWLWDDSARTLLLSGDPLHALTLHPGGWLGVAAAMRGVRHAFEVDDRAVTRLVLVGVPALAIPWALGQLAPAELRAAFVEAAFVASLTFVASGFMAAGLARLQEIGRETGIDWRHDRSWLGTVLGVLLAVLALGIPAAMLLGLPGDVVARGILGPVVTLLAYAFIAVLAATALVAALLAMVLSGIGIRLPAPMTPDEIGRLPGVTEYTIDELRDPLTVLAAFWIVVAVVIIVLLRVWIRRRAGPRRRTTTEERSFRLPPRLARSRAARSPRAPARPRGLEPTDAVEAYLATLDGMADHDPARARVAHETPRAHARRIGASSDLVALQADYALARYGNRTLAATEHRRALGRWRRLRDGLRALH